MKKIFGWTNLRLVLMFGAIGFLLAFSSKRNEDRMLAKSVVEFTGGDNLFITNESVNKLLIENKNDIKTIRKDKVDLNRLEKSLNRHEMIEKSEVFVTIDGVLKAG
jgi:cell division protein FtsQ